MAFSDLGNGAGYVYLYQNASSPAPAAVRFNGINGAADPAYPAVNRTNQIVRFVTDWMNDNPGYRVYINANYGGPASPNARGGLAVEITTDLINNIGGVGISQLALQAGGLNLPTIGTTTTAIVNTGTTITVTKNASPQYIIIDGEPVTMVANSSIVASGTWIAGDVINILIRQDVVLNGNTLVVLGNNITAQQLCRSVHIEAVYNGSAWVLSIYPISKNTSTGGVSAKQMTVEGAAAGQVLLSTGASTGEPSYTAISGDATLSGLGVLTVANDAITVPKLSGQLKTQSLTIYASFETGSLATVPYVNALPKCTLVSASVSVYKTISSTNDGTITIKNGTNIITGGVITVPQSTAAGTIIGTSALSGVHANFDPSVNTLNIQTAKPSAGGICTLTLKYILQP